MDAVQDMVLGPAWASLPPAGKVFFSVGAVMGLSFALRVLRWVWAFFLRPAVNLKKLGKWGIVTVSARSTPLLTRSHLSPRLRCSWRLCHTQFTRIIANLQSSARRRGAQSLPLRATSAPPAARRVR